MIKQHLGEAKRRRLAHAPPTITMDIYGFLSDPGSHWKNWSWFFLDTRKQELETCRTGPNKHRKWNKLCLVMGMKYYWPLYCSPHSVHITQPSSLCYLFSFPVCSHGCLGCCFGVKCFSFSCYGWICPLQKRKVKKNFAFDVRWCAQHWYS